MLKLRYFFPLIIVGLLFSSCRKDSAKIETTINQVLDPKKVNLDELNFEWDLEKFDLTEDSDPEFRLYKVTESKDSLRGTIIDLNRIDKRTPLEGNSVKIPNENREFVSDAGNYIWEVVDTKNKKNRPHKFLPFRTGTLEIVDEHILAQIGQSQFRTGDDNDIKHMRIVDPLDGDEDKDPGTVHGMTGGSGNLVKGAGGNENEVDNFDDSDWNVNQLYLNLDNDYTLDAGDYKLYSTFYISIPETASVNPAEAYPQLFINGISSSFTSDPYLVNGAERNYTTNPPPPSLPNRVVIHNEDYIEYDDLGTTDPLDDRMECKVEMTINFNIPTTVTNNKLNLAFFLEMDHQDLRTAHTIIPTFPDPSSMVNVQGEPILFYLHNHQSETCPSDSEELMFYKCRASLSTRHVSSHVNIINIGPRKTVNE